MIWYPLRTQRHYCVLPGACGTLPGVGVSWTNQTQCLSVLPPTLVERLWQAHRKDEAARKNAQARKRRQ